MLKKISVFLLVLLMVAGCKKIPTSSVSSKINVENYKSGETIRYSVPIIYGNLSNPAVTDLEVINTSLSEKDPNYKMQAQVLNGKFKGITSLKKGENKICLKAGNSKTDLIINYKPQTNPYKVRMVYFTDKTGNTIYETPNPNDNQDYHSKFDTGLKLMQSFSAERLNDLGYGRKTFNIDCDENGMANVYVVTGSLTEAEYSYMPRHKLYYQIQKDIENALPKDKIINLATVAFSKHDTNTQRNTAYTALGGGNLALFGGAIMFTWPNSLSNAQARLMDATEIDTYNYAHDDKGRATYWGTATTTIGAALHELGHAFGLPHTTDRMDIMTRGIDHFNRAFVFQDAPSAKNDRKYVDYADNEIAYWAPVSASGLVPSRYFGLDAKEYSSSNTLSITYNDKDEKLDINGPAGIAFVSYEKPGIAIDFEENYDKKEFPTEHQLDFQKVVKTLPDHKKIKIRARDMNGDMAIVNMSKVSQDDQISWKVEKSDSPW